RGGMVYEERSLAVPNEGGERVDFWCADALGLPFRPSTFGVAASVNVLDCVPDPLAHLAALRDVLRPAGGALVSTPFDWSPAATPVEAWIGGHSPYDDALGRSESA